MAAELAGWTVVVTRAEGPGGALGSALRAHGADVVYLPTVEVVPPRDAGPLERALSAIGDFDWLVVTSPRAVDALVESGAVLPGWTKVAAVGESTARRAREAGFSVALTGEGGGAGALAETLLAAGVDAGTRILFPASSRARPELREILEAAGVEVQQVEAYRTAIRAFEPRDVPELRRADVVTFTSPSAVEGWCLATKGEAARFVADGVRYVVIGETTGTALGAHGLAGIAAPETSLEGVVSAVRSLALEKDG